MDFAELQDLNSVRQVAAFFCRNPRSILRWEFSGRFPHAVKVGAARFYRKTDIIRWFLESKTQPRQYHRKRQEQTASITAVPAESDTALAGQ